MNMKYTSWTSFLYTSHLLGTQKPDLTVIDRRNLLLVACENAYNSLKDFMVIDGTAWVSH